MMTRCSALGALAIPLLLAAGRPAVAKPCNDPTIVNPIYGLGGSASKPFLAKLSTALAKLSGADQATIVFQSPGACVGIYGVIDDTKITGTASYWDASGVEQTCDLPAGGQAIDFANMANSAALCSQAPNPLPAEIGDYEGPVNSIDFVVPLASSQVAISAAAGYFVFGFGTAGQAAPWVNESLIFIRDQNSAVQQLLGVAINVPAEKWTHGVNALNQNGVITKVAAASDPEAAIGIVSGEAADGARDKVRILAYQHYGQSCGYLPDSTSTAFDKRNVRDGHYYVWTPQHFFARKDAITGEIVSPSARKLIGYITGDVALPAGFDLLTLEIQANTVPKCAMKVWRSGDLGPLVKYTPPRSCAGYFESLKGSTTGLTACPGGPSDCPSSAPACNYGYCEVQ
ncbi:MAG: hypothetical protein K8W52_07885 [Deltaproteobacteria bacterium]|nr:hypothetical protein [Deltaproteobacteria bacterium]